MKTFKFFFVALTIFGFLITSCKKDDKDIPIDFIDPNSTFNSLFQGFGLNGYTSPMDSFNTHNQSLFVLGAINDPVFGISRASIATAFGIPGNSSTFSFGDSATLTIDSVVLQLRIGNDSTLAGNSNAFHNFKVYELAEKLSTDSVYASNRNYIKSAQPIGSFEGTFSPKDSVKKTYYADSIRIPASLRIKLSNEFANKFKTTGTFSKTTFNDIFKGLVIEDESVFAPNDGGFFYFNLFSQYSNLIVYYRTTTTTDTANKTNYQRADFSVSFSAQYNKFETNSKHLTQPKTTKFNISQKRDTGYIQGLTGTKLRIYIPDSLLHALAANRKLAILKAEIVLKELFGNSSDYFKTPNQLSLLSTDSLGKSILTEDAKLESFIYFGGANYRGEYRFNIARELNFLLNSIRTENKNQHYGLSVIVPDSDFGSQFFQTSARRILIDLKNIKLNLNYTVVK